MLVFFSQNFALTCFSKKFAEASENVGIFCDIVTFFFSQKILHCFRFLSQISYSRKCLKNLAFFLENFRSLETLQQTLSLESLYPTQCRRPFILFLWIASDQILNVFEKSNVHIIRLKKYKDYRFEWVAKDLFFFSARQMIFFQFMSNDIFQFTSNDIFQFMSNVC